MRRDWIGMQARTVTVFLLAHFLFSLLLAGLGIRAVISRPRVHVGIVGTGDKPTGDSDMSDKAKVWTMYDALFQLIGLNAPVDTAGAKGTGEGKAKGDGDAYPQGEEKPELVRAVATEVVAEVVAGNDPQVKRLRMVFNEDHQEQQRGADVGGAHVAAKSASPAGAKAGALTVAAASAMNSSAPMNSKVLQACMRIYDVYMKASADQEAAHEPGANSPAQKGTWVQLKDSTGFKGVNAEADQDEERAKEKSTVVAQPKAAAQGEKSQDTVKDRVGMAPRPSSPAPRVQGGTRQEQAVVQLLKSTLCIIEFFLILVK